MLNIEIERLAHKAWVNAQMAITTADFYDACVFSIKDTQGFIGVNGDILFIAFQGSADIKDVLSDINIRYTEIGYGMKVHTGFYKQYKDIEKVIEIKASSFSKIVFSGQSLGGALAILSSHFMEERFPMKDIACVTFASPKVGNKTFNDHYLVEIKQYQYKEDIVCLLPPSIFGYRHTSKAQKFGKYKIWEYLLFPITKLFGNPLDHTPANYYTWEYDND
jgi:hypothetical protein